MIILRSPLFDFKNLKLDIQIFEVFKTNSILSEALFHASPDLYNEYLRAINNEITDKLRIEKLSISLYKYYVRAHTRSTPFGLFAGISCINWGDFTNIKFSNKYNVRIRFDMYFLCHLYHNLMLDSNVFSKLNYKLNNTLYKCFDKWRYIEYTLISDERTYKISSIDDNILLSKLFSFLKIERSYLDIKDYLNKLGVEDEQAFSFIKTLIDNQVIWSNIYPIVTKIEYQKKLLDIISTISPDKFSEINKLSQKLLNNVKLNVKSSIENLKLLSENAGLEINDKYFVQIDVFKGSQSSALNKSIRNIIKTADRILEIINLSGNGNKRIDNFKKRFLDRFRDEFIPISNVLDVDLGLNYKDISYNSGVTDKPTSIKFKIALMKRALKSNSQIVEISDEDINSNFKYVPSKISEPFYFMGGILADKFGKEYVDFNFTSSSTPLSITGRFGFLNSKIRKFNESISLHESNKFENAIVAEIAHLPQGRIGNTITRPAYRKYEIPYLVDSISNNKIYVDDLYIGIREDLLLLYSKKYEKVIIPLLSNAHNFANNSLPIYHFLCDLSSQFNKKSTYNSWDWEILENEPYLPRVVYKNVIFSPSKWKINTNKLKKTNFSDSNWIAAFLKRYELPDCFKIVDGDNFIFINTKEELSRKVLVEQILKKDLVSIEEFLFTEFSKLPPNEVVIPFLEAGKITLPILKGKTILEKNINRIFFPTSEWIYFKIYLSNFNANKFILDIIYHLNLELKKKKLIKSWFYIRYFDQSDHIRLRYKVRNVQDWGEIINICMSYMNKFILSNIIWDLKMDTYHREIDRYTVKAINKSESIFCLNSEISLIYLKEIGNKYMDVSLYFYAVYYIDFLFESFGLTLNESIDLSKQISEGFIKEFSSKISESERKGIYEKYRSINKELVSFIEKRKVDFSFKLYEEHILLEKHAKVIKSINGKVTEAQKRELISSHLHMFINRLFSENQRYHELICYIWFNKYLHHINSKLN